MLVPGQVLGLQQQTGRQVVVETESKQAGSKQGDCSGRCHENRADDHTAAAVVWMDVGKPLPKG